MRRLYVQLCKLWGPGGLTVSAWAWKTFLLTGDAFWRDRIDGAMLFWFSEHNHCQACWQRESRGIEL